MKIKNLVKGQFFHHNNLQWHKVCYGRSGKGVSAQCVHDGEVSQFSPSTEVEVVLYNGPRNIRVSRTVVSFHDNAHGRGERHRGYKVTPASRDRVLRVLSDLDHGQSWWSRSGQQLIELHWSER